MGKICPAFSLSWPQASSSAFRLPVHNPNTSTHPSPFVFQSFQGHIPPILTLYQGETASKSIPQISVLYTSPLTSSSNPFSMASSCHITMSSVPLGVSQTLLHTFQSSSFLVVHLWQCSHTPLKFFWPSLAPLHSDHLAPCRVCIRAITDYNPCSFVVWQKQEVKQNTPSALVCFSLLWFKGTGRHVCQATIKSIK